MLACVGLTSGTPTETLVRMNGRPIVLVGSITLVMAVVAGMLSHWVAVTKADALMAPAIEQGWYRLGVFWILNIGDGFSPHWWIHYDIDTAMLNTPPAVYVSILGKIDDREVSRILRHYEAESAAGTR